MIATIWEIRNDRFGDLNKGSDIMIRIILLLAEGLAIHFIFYKPTIDSILLPMAIFFLCFDYGIAYTLLKNGTVEPKRGETLHWFTYTAKEGFVDNIPKWKKLHPITKLIIRILFFTGSIIILWK